MAKSKWEDVKNKLDLVEAWFRDGATEQTVADKLGIHICTLEDYKNKYPEFTKALKRGKEVIDVQVENSLLKRALGYEYEEITIEESEKSGKTVKKVIKQVVPDTTAQIFWLKNRKVREWRDKQEVEHTGNVNVKTTIAKIEEYEELFKGER